MGRPKKNSNSASAYVPKKVLSFDGAFDITAETDTLWSSLFKRINALARTYGFERVETPIVEDLRLYETYYKSNVKALANLVSVSIGGKPGAVRPHLLPSILRAYYQNKTQEQSQLSKWQYGGVTTSLAEDGALVSDYAFGFEVFGAFTHLTEAQVVGGVWEFLQSLGLKDSVLEINHIGKAACQEAYEQTLQDFLQSKKYQLCDNCNEDLKGRVLNILRCENLDCQAAFAEAPTVLDFLEEDSKAHFTNILEALDELGVPYQLNPLYAGPYGYSKTNLVIKYKFKNQIFVLGEGGYHDSLIQNLSGKSFSCFGFSGSLSKIKEVLDLNKTTVAKESKNDVFLVPLGELAAKRSLRLFKDLAAEKISVYDHFGNAGVKNQLKQAETFQAPVALIMGQKEAMDEMVILRDVKSGMQEIISYDKIVSEVKKRLGR